MLAAAALLWLVCTAAGAEAGDEALLTLRNAVAEQKARNVALEGALERLAVLEKTDVCKAPDESRAVLDDVSALRSAPPAPAATSSAAPAPAATEAPAAAADPAKEASPAPAQ